MRRKKFLNHLATIPLLGVSMKLSALHNTIQSFDSTSKMPVLFLGHGSPMNAIEENEFVQGFRKVGREIEKPNAVLCISAHWETRGTRVTAMDMPRTIHDFGGFPQELFDVQYPAPGHPKLAGEIKEGIKNTEIELDDKWGLDHGAWSVIKHMYPDADVPVIQLSLDINKSPQAHYALAQEMSGLRDKGVLIVGSGNMVHNLREVAWTKLNDTDYAYDWARLASDNMKSFIKNNNHRALIDYEKQGREFQLAIPTAEHYLPLLYALGLKENKEEIQLFNDKAVGGSLTMTSVRVG